MKADPIRILSENFAMYVVASDVAWFWSQVAAAAAVYMWEWWYQQSRIHGGFPQDPLWLEERYNAIFVEP